MNLRYLINAATALCFAAILTGCGRSPQVSFYTLGSAVKGGTAVPPKSTPSVSVVNITLPILVDRPQLVENVTINRLEIQESHRWAEPLKNGISRLLAENLAARLGTDMVTAYPQNAVGEPDYKVSVDIQRFEVLGENVSVDALWSIRKTAVTASDQGKQDKAPFTKTGRSQLRESRSGAGYEALVAAYNRAITSLGNDIAVAIRADLEGVKSEFDQKAAP